MSSIVIDMALDKALADLHTFLEEHPEMDKRMQEGDEGFFEALTAFHEWAEAKLSSN